VTKVICYRISGENTSSKTRELVGKIRIIRNIMRLKREVGNEGEGVEGIFNNRRRNGVGGVGRRGAGREGSIKKRMLPTRTRRMRKLKSISSRRRRRIRITTRKRGGKEKVRILTLKSPNYIPSAICWHY
jgi:hypothetical protein